MTDKSEDLTEGPVWRALWRVSAPMAIGILGVLAVGLTDAYVLARVGQTELAAIGFVYPVIVTIAALSIGLSAGANAVLSQAMGRDAERGEIARTFLHATLLAATLGVSVALAFWLLARPLFSLLGASGEVLEAILSYVPYWAASLPLLITTMVCEATFRAHGSGAKSALTMVFTAVLNIALTPILVWGVWLAPEMGMSGAGVGTLLARGAAVVLALGLAGAMGLFRTGTRGLWSGFAPSARKITGIGAPAAFSRAINPAGMAIVTAAVATLGDTAVAGFGAAARVQSLALVPFLALASGLGPVVGQAWGAAKPERARTAMKVAALFCLGYGIALAVLLFFGAETLAGIMTARAEAAVYTERYLMIVGWSFAGYGLAVAANAAMTARSRAGWALGLSLGRILIVYIPCAWLFVSIWGYGGILAAAVAANAAALWGALVMTYVTGIGPSAVAPVRAPARGLATLSRRAGGQEPSE